MTALCLGKCLRKIYDKKLFTDKKTMKEITKKDEEKLDNLSSYFLFLLLLRKCIKKGVLPRQKSARVWGLG